MKTVKIIIAVLLIFNRLAIYSQWNPTMVPGTFWAPPNSSSPNVLPAGVFNHNAAIQGNFTLSVNGGSTYALNNSIGGGNSIFPVGCGGPLIFRVELTGGATFANTILSGSIASSFALSSSSSTVLEFTQTQNITHQIAGSAFPFSVNVLTPGYSSVFTITITLFPNGSSGQTQPADCDDGDILDKNLTEGITGNPADDRNATSGSTNRILPIESFSIQNLSKKPNGLQIVWMTKYENNVDYFEVERMYHGAKSDWMKVAEIESAGDTKDEIQYDYMDKSYGRAEKLYYRIKSIDRDGTVGYTSVKAIDLKENSNVKLIGYPNPVRESFHMNINLIEDTDLGIDLIDILGKTVSTQKIQGKKGFTNQDLNFSNLVDGTYIVKVSGKDVFKTMTVVKM